MANRVDTHTADEILTQVKEKLGFVPNLFREMSISPSALLVYLDGQEALAAGFLSPRERQAVQLTVSAVNRCHYCQAAHEWLGGKVGISAEEREAIREGYVPADEKLATVVLATRQVLEKKGWLDVPALRALEQRGITRARLYEIIAYIGLKTISNYVNHIAHTPIDEQFRPEGKSCAIDTTNDSTCSC